MQLTFHERALAATLGDLAPGDVLEIKYRIWKPSHEAAGDMVERWFRAIVIDCEPGTWPLARLADGQATEIRPFMVWRCIARSERRPFDRAA